MFNPPASAAKIQLTHEVSALEEEGKADLKEFLGIKGVKNQLAIIPVNRSSPSTVPVSLIEDIMKTFIVVALLAICSVAYCEEEVAEAVAAVPENPTEEVGAEDFVREVRSYGHGGHQGGSSAGHGGHGGYGHHGGSSGGHGGHGYGHGGHSGGHGGYGKHGGYGHSGGHGSSHGSGHGGHGYRSAAANAAADDAPNMAEAPAAQKSQSYAPLVGSSYGYGHQESHHGYGHGGHHGGHGYGHHGYAHAGPAKSYAYHSPAPHVPCGHNLLFGCHPSVAPVPCHGHSYGHHSYGHHGY